MTTLDDWDVCDDHEQSFPRHGFCKDCRIAELEAKVERLSARGIEDMQDTITTLKELADAADLAIQMDFEQGVAWMTDEAYPKFKKEYPYIWKVLSDLMGTRGD